MTDNIYCGMINHLQVSQEKKEQWAQLMLCAEELPVQENAGNRKSSGGNGRKPFRRWALAACAAVLCLVGAGVWQNQELIWPEKSVDRETDQTAELTVNINTVAEEENKLAMLWEENSAGIQQMQSFSGRTIELEGRQFTYQVREMEDEKRAAAESLIGEELCEYGEKGTAYQIKGRSDKNWLLLREEEQLFLAHFFQLEGAAGTALGEIWQLVYDVDEAADFEYMVFRKTDVDNTDKGKSIQVPAVSLDEAERSRLYEILSPVESISDEEYSENFEEGAWDVYDATGEVAKVLRFLELTTVQGDLVKYTYDPVQACVMQGGYGFYKKLSKEDNQWLIELAQIDMSIGTTEFTPAEDNAEPVTGDDARTNEQGQFATVYEMFCYWEENGYPDYVGGVYSRDGSMDEMVVMIVGNDQKAKDKVLDQLISRKGLYFNTAEYSMNEMMKVQQEIQKEMQAQTAGNVKIYSMGLGWTSVDGNVTGFGESGKEFRVVVTVDESVYVEYKEKYEKAYGGIVHLEAASSGTVHDLAIAEEE